MRLNRFGVSFAAALLVSPLALAEDLYVLDAWASVHVAASERTHVLGRLTTNTKVQLVSRATPWCTVRTAAGLEGKMLCQKLGAQPMLLAQAKDPANAFWIAPSPMRLVDYGHAIRGNTQQTFRKLQGGDVAAIPRSAQFDAAKKRMEAGAVVPLGVQDWRGAPVKPSAMPFAEKLLPKPVKASLFKSQAEVRLETESTVDTAAALAGAHVTMAFSGKPLAWSEHHGGPEIAGITGFGDVGGATVRFDPALTVYSVERNGLLAAASMAAVTGFGQGGEDYCPGITYSWEALNGSRYGMLLSGELQAIKGYPERSDGSPLLVFFTTRKLDPRKPKTSSRTAKMMVDGALATIALHEVDLDRDGSADVLVWEKARAGELSEGPVFDRFYYVNVGGRWFDAGNFVENECT